MAKIYNFPRPKRVGPPARDKRIGLSLKALANVGSLIESLNAAGNPADFCEAEPIREAALLLHAKIESMIVSGRYDQAEVDGILTDASRLLNDIDVNKTRLKVPLDERA